MTSAAATIDAPDLETLARLQCDVVSRAQLRRCAPSRAAMRWKLNSARWRSVGPLVVALHSGPLSKEQQQWAAVLSGGAGAVLGGRTALAVAGLNGFPDPAVHVLVPHGRRWPRLDDIDVRWHVTRRWPPADRQPGSGVPRARVERAAIDGAVWTQRPRAACGLLAAVVQQRLTTADRLLVALDAAGPIRHAPLLASVLVDIEGGAAAMSEVDFGRLCERYRLPPPLRQAVREDGDGRRRYVDAELVSPTGERVSVEVDGAAHMAAAQWWADSDRANELTIAGDRTLRFPSVLFYTQPERVADQIRRALQLP